MRFSEAHQKKLHKTRTQGCTSGSQMADKMAATKAASGGSNTGLESQRNLGNQIPNSKCKQQDKKVGHQRIFKGSGSGIVFSCVKLS